MFLRSSLRSKPRSSVTPSWTRPELVNGGFNLPTLSGQKVSVESAKRIATAYRCANIISDHIGIMPLQTIIRRVKGQIEQMKPDWQARNIAYLLEVAPNRYMNPFIFKKTRAQWLIHYGNSYVWSPPARERELFLLHSDNTYPFTAKDGSLWYHTTFPNGEQKDIPDVEITHEMINSVDGITGRGVLTFARETMGIRMAENNTIAKFMASGLNVSGVIEVAGDLDVDARKKVKDEFVSNVGGSDNAYGVAVIDQKMLKFTPVTMSAVDMQFLQLIQGTDVDICNFYGMPLHMVNMGKQAYNSNDQKFEEYLTVTLNPYLVQGEQAGRTKWLREDEQPYTYFKYIREALLSMSPDAYAKYIQVMISYGQMTPDEGREKKDMSNYASMGQSGGDRFYMTSNIQPIGGAQNAQSN